MENKSVVTLGADLIVGIIVQTEVNWGTLQWRFVSESSPHQVGLFVENCSLARLLRVRGLESEDYGLGEYAKQEGENEGFDHHFNYNYKPFN